MNTDPSAFEGQGREAFDRLFEVTYQELKRLASSVRRHEPNVTLTPTALVNEAWLKLAGNPALASLPPLHFKRIAARAMRQVLVEAARRRSATKRGGPDHALVTFDEEVAGPVDSAEQVLDLDQALDRLAALSDRQAAVVEARFFGGLETTEIAELLAVSEATVLRDWRAAKAWLGKEIG